MFRLLIFGTSNHQLVPNHICPPRFAFFCFIASHNSINSFIFVLGGSDFICFYFCLLDRARRSTVPKTGSQEVRDESWEGKGRRRKVWWKSSVWGIGRCGVESKSDDAEDAYCDDMAAMSQWGDWGTAKPWLETMQSMSKAVGFLWADILAHFDVGRCSVHWRSIRSIAHCCRILHGQLPHASAGINIQCQCVCVRVFFVFA